MRILLDESVPARLGPLLTGHSAVTVQRRGPVAANVRPHMNAQRTHEQHARHIVEAVSKLHSQGFGRLRLFCYVKEGLPAWRHLLFVSEFFQRGTCATPLFSVPTNPISLADNSEAIAKEIKDYHPDLIEQARGPFDDYCAWFKKIIEFYPNETFEMEDASIASMGSKRLPTPFSRPLQQGDSAHSSL